MKIFLLAFLFAFLVNLGFCQQLDFPAGAGNYYSITSDTVLYFPAATRALTWNSAFAVQVAQPDTSADTAVTIDLLHSLIDTARFYCSMDDARLPYSLGSKPSFMIYGQYVPGWFYAVKLTGYTGGTYYLKIYLKAVRAKN